MSASKPLLLAVLLIPAALALSGCTQMGIEPAAGLIVDTTQGTMYLAPEMANDFDMERLKDCRSYYVNKLVVPAPFTFGLLSFGWGDVSTKTIMAEANFKRLLYAHYRRLNILTVYQNYEIVAYGE